MKPLHNPTEKVPATRSVKRKHTDPAEVQSDKCTVPDWNLVQELKNVTSELSELKISVQYMSEKYDDLLKEIKNGREENTQLREEIAQLTENNISLNSRFEVIEREWNQGKQELIRNNVVLFGFSDQANTKLEVISTVNKILHKVNMDKSDVLNDCYQRSPNKNQPGAIVLKFKNTEAKNNFIKVVKRLELKTSDFGLCTKKSNLIRLSEQLTPLNQQLLNEARQLRTHGYKFIWSKNGRILARKSANSDILVIHNFDYIDSLKSTNQTI